MMRVMWRIYDTEVKFNCRRDMKNGREKDARDEQEMGEMAENRRDRTKDVKKLVLSVKISYHLFS